MNEEALRRVIPRFLIVYLALVATLLASGVAHAQRTPTLRVDRRRQLEPGEKKPGEQASPWRGSTFQWSNSATAQTLGIGDDVQSENPTFEMSFALAPRYTLWRSDDELSKSFAVGARLETYREFTNSDSTTERGEWLLGNLALGPQYAHTLYERDGFETSFGIRAPVLSFPTSKASRNNGTILGLGGTVLGVQKLPLLGDDSAVLRSVTLTPLVGYGHVFRETTTPTNPDLERERMGPDMVTVPSDQLSGRAFPDHQVTLGLTATLEIHERVRWSNLFEWHLDWRYPFRDDVELEGAVLTGAAPVENGSDAPQNFAVVALFASEVGVTITRELEVEAGYQNLAPQLGADGEHRSMFYSPEARFLARLVLNLDAVYERIAGGQRSEVATIAGHP
jgi:hypothetical protein